MTDVPRVSVVIPTHNRSCLLGKAIESVLGQTFDSYEIIIVDDGSTDDTCSVVDKYDSPRIRYCYQENKGRSAARNYALNLAQGEYIAFLDSDDTFYPQKLELQVALLDSNPEYGMSYTSARVVDEHGIELFRDGTTSDDCPYYRAIDSGWIYDKVALYLPVTVILPTVMVRTGIVRSVGGFDESLSRFEDTDFWRRVSKITPVIAIAEPLTTVLTHSGNRMETPDEVYRSLSRYVGKVFREDADRNPTVLREGAARLFLHYGYAVNAVHGQWRQAEPFFRDAIDLEPRYAVDSLLESRMMVVAQTAGLLVNKFRTAPVALFYLFLCTAMRNTIILVKRLLRGDN